MATAGHVLRLVHFFEGITHAKGEVERHYHNRSASSHHHHQPELLGKDVPSDDSTRAPRPAIDHVESPPPEHHLLPALISVPRSLSEAVQTPLCLEKQQIQTHSLQVNAGFDGSSRDNFFGLLFLYQPIGRVQSTLCNKMTSHEAPTHGKLLDRLDNISTAPRPSSQAPFPSSTKYGEDTRGIGPTHDVGDEGINGQVCHANVVDSFSIWTCKFVEEDLGEKTVIADKEGEDLVVQGLAVIPTQKLPVCPGSQPLESAGTDKREDLVVQGLAVIPTQKLPVCPGSQPLESAGTDKREDLVVQGLAVIPTQKLPLHSGQWSHVPLLSGQFKLARGLVERLWPTVSDSFSGFRAPPPSLRGFQQQLPRLSGRWRLPRSGGTKPSVCTSAVPGSPTRRSTRLRRRREAEEQQKRDEERIREEENARKALLAKKMDVTSLLRFEKGQESWLDSWQIAACLKVLVSGHKSIKVLDGDLFRDEKKEKIAAAIDQLFSGPVTRVIAVVCLDNHFTTFMLTKDTAMHYNSSSTGSVPKKIRDTLSLLQYDILSLKQPSHRVPVQKDDNINCGVYCMEMVRAWIDGRKLHHLTAGDLQEARRSIVLSIMTKRRCTYQQTILHEDDVREWNTWTEKEYEKRKKKWEREGRVLVTTDDEVYEDSGEELAEESEEEHDDGEHDVPSHMDLELVWSADPSRTPTPAPTVHEMPPSLDCSVLLEGDMETQETKADLPPTPPTPPTPPPHDCSTSAPNLKRVIDENDCETKKKKMTPCFFLISARHTMKVVRPIIIVDSLQSVGITQVVASDISTIKLIPSYLRDGSHFQAVDFNTEDVATNCSETLQTDDAIRNLHSKNTDVYTDLFLHVPEERFVPLSTFLLLLIKNDPELDTIENFASIARNDWSACSKIVVEAGEAAVCQCLERFTKKGKEAVRISLKYYVPST